MLLSNIHTQIEDEEYEYDAEYDDDEIDVKEAELNWGPDKSIVPRGWDVNILEVKVGDMAGTRLVRYKSPCGNYFGNLPEVLKFLQDNEVYSDKDKRMFQAGLKDDGWEKDSHLPQDWSIKFVKGRGFVFLAPNYDVVNCDDIEMYLAEQLCLEDDEIQRFASKWKDINWEPHFSVPQDWKVASVLEKNGDHVRRFLSPSGEEFLSRPEAISSMIKSGKYSSEDITRMQLGMSEDDWMFDEYLPVGWFKKLYGTKWYFCSSHFQIFQNTEEVLRYFLEVDMAKEVVDKFSNLVEVDENLLPPPPPVPEPKSVTPKKKKKKAKSKEAEKSPSTKRKSSDKDSGLNKKKVKSEPKEIIVDSSNDNLPLPPKWRFDVEEGREIIFSDKEEKFKSRRDAVEFMVKKNYNPKMIYTLWNTLHTEGWLTDDNQKIPPGWRIKYFESVYDYKYLTRELKVLHSTKEAVAAILKDKDLGEYVEKFKSWAGDVQRKEKKIEFKPDPTVPANWQLGTIEDNFVIQYKPTLGRFESRIESIEFMIKANFSSADIFSMWSFLDHEGWIADEDNLPRGWRKRNINSKENGNWYLGPMMEVMKSTSDLLKCVRKQDKYNKDDISKVEKLKAKELMFR